MKNIILFIVSFAAVNLLFADLKTVAYESAKKSATELAEFRAQKLSEIAQCKKTLAEKRNRIRVLNDKLSLQNSYFAERVSLKNLSSFYDDIAASIAVDMQTFAAEFAPSSVDLQMRAKSMDECYANLQKACSESIDRLFNPTSPRDFTAKLFDGQKIDGKMFRVGGFRYFISDSHAGLLDESGILYAQKYAADIRDFAADKIDTLPADISAGSYIAAEKNSRSFAREISLGGIWMYPILLLGFVSGAVFVIKLFSFARIRRAPNGIVRRIKVALADKDEKTALSIAAKSGYPYSLLLSDLIRSRNLPQAMLEEVSYESMLGAGEKLFSYLSALSVSAAVAPLLGLLGTVTGIIKTFGDLSFAGAGQAQFISAGISEALITTEYGLVVAIPAYVAHAIFSRRAKSVLSDMEKLASSFLSGN